MRVVNMHDAKTHFSKLVNAVVQGQEIIIAISGKPVAKLGPIEKEKKRKFGVLKGKIKIHRDFDDPLTEEVLKQFEE